MSVSPTIDAPTGDGRPLVVACLRICDLRPQVDPLTGSIARDPWGIGLSAADAAALEYALRVADAWSGRVVAVAAGPATIEPALVEVAALGASVLRVPTSDTDTDPGAATGHPYEEELGEDEHRLARTIVGALEPWGAPAVVVCGDRSADRGTGALPGFLAHRWGAAQALGLVSLEVEPPRAGTAPHLLGQRRLDGGWREQLRVPLPAVCSVEGAGVRLRRASLAGTLAADSSAVRLERSSPMATAERDRPPAPVRVGASRSYRPRTRVLPAPPADDPRIRLLDLTGALTTPDPPTVIGPVGAADAADELIGFLVRHGYLETAPSADLGGGDASPAEGNR